MHNLLNVISKFRDASKVGPPPYKQTARSSLQSFAPRCSVYSYAKIWPLDEGFYCFFYFRIFWLLRRIIFGKVRSRPCIMWAAKRILLSESSNKYAFERYNQHSSTSANSATFRFKINRLHHFASQWHCA